MDKLEQLAEDWGMSVDDMLAAATFDSVSPGICTDPVCTYTTEVEPDQRGGWCEMCGKGSVASALVLADCV